MRTRCYPTFYNRTFLLIHKKKRVEPWIRSCLRVADVQTQLRISHHVLTMARTQSLGTKLDDRLVKDADIVRRLCVWRQTVLLRRLQRKLIEHLWRPGGLLFLKHRPLELLQSNPTGSDR